MTPIPTAAKPRDAPPARVSATRGASLTSLPAPVLARVVDFVHGTFGREGVFALLLSCRALAWPAVAALWREPPVWTGPRALLHLARMVRPPTGPADPPGAPAFDYAAYVKVLRLGRAWMDKEHAFLFERIVLCVGPNLERLDIRHAIARRLRLRGFDVALTCPNLRALCVDHDDYASRALLPMKLPGLRELDLRGVVGASKDLLVHACQLYANQLELFKFNCSEFADREDDIDDVRLSFSEIQTIAEALASVQRLHLELPNVVEPEVRDDRLPWRVLLFQIMRTRGLPLKEVTLWEQHLDEDRLVEEAVVDTDSDSELADGDGAGAGIFPNWFGPGAAENFDYNRLTSTAGAGIVVTPHSLRLVYTEHLRSLVVRSDGVNSRSLRGLALAAPNLVKLELQTEVEDSWADTFVNEFGQLAYLEHLALRGFSGAQTLDVVRMLKSLSPLRHLNLRLYDQSIQTHDDPILKAIYRYHVSSLQYLSFYSDLRMGEICSTLDELSRRLPTSHEEVSHPYDPRQTVPAWIKLRTLILDYSAYDEHYAIPEWLQFVANVSGTKLQQNPRQNYDFISFRGEQLKLAIYSSSLKELALNNERRLLSLRYQRMERDRAEKEEKARRKASKNKGAPEPGSDSEIDAEEEEEEEEEESEEREDSDSSPLDKRSDTEAEEEEIVEEMVEEPEVEFDSDGREIVKDSDGAMDLDEEVADQAEEGYMDPTNDSDESGDSAEEEDSRPPSKRPRTDAG